MKILPWVLLAAAIAALCFVWNDQQQLRQRFAKLQSDVSEVEDLRAEIAELKKTPPASAELERLQKEVTEIHKLRNEVRQLRTENQTLSQRVQQQQHSQVTVINSDPQQPQLTEVEQLQKENEQLRHENEQFHRARLESQGNACINNLKQIDGATEQWALENNMGVGALPAWPDLVGPDKYIRRQPVCPMGGQYTIRGVGQSPTCDIPGHELPQ